MTPEWKKRNACQMNICDVIMTPYASGHRLTLPLALSKISASVCGSKSEQVVGFKSLILFELQSESNT